MAKEKESEEYQGAFGGDPKAERGVAAAQDREKAQTPASDKAVKGPKETK